MIARFFAKPFFVALLLWVFLVVTLYLLVNLLVMPYFAGKFIGKVAVPALVRLQPEKAKDILKSNGLLFMMDSSGDYSNDIGAGKIISQYPTEGTEVKKGRRIWVRISKGLKSVELPSLRGLSLRQAEITLQQLGLKMGRVKQIQNANFPSGAVIGTLPVANSHLEKGRSVEIELSLGKDAQPTGLPSLTGLTLSQAKEQVQKLGLKLGKVTIKKDPHSLPNTVLSQSPPAGSASEGKAIGIVVSK